MAKFICPKCKERECIVDSDALLYPDFADFDLSFKCYSCKETFVAKFTLTEFWQIDKKILKQYKEWKQQFADKKENKDDIQQMRLF